MRRRFPPFLQEQKKDLVKFENVIEIHFYEIFCDFFVYGMVCVHLSPGIFYRILHSEILPFDLEASKKHPWWLKAIY